MPKIRLSQSSLRSWRRCRLMFHYKYIEKLAPKKFVRPLHFGSTVHKVLEYRAQGKSLDKALKFMEQERATLFTADIDQFEQTMTDARLIMTAYNEHWSDENVTPVKVGNRIGEHEFVYELPGGMEFEGIVDLFVETPDGRRWLVEHKSHKKIPTEDVRMRDLQTLTYHVAAREALGVKRLAGSLWDYICSISPSVPEILKNGTLSKRRIRTLPSVFRAEIKKHKLKEEHYEDKLEELEGKMGEWFKRVFTPINKDAVAIVIEETVTTGREIHRKAGIDKTRSMSRDCSFCSYERLCHAELFGLDANFIREREFKIKEPKNVVEAED